MPDDRATHATYETVQPDGTIWNTSVPGDAGRPGWSWRHVDLVNPHARSNFEADLTWPAHLRRIVSGNDETPQIITEDDAIAGVLPTYARTGIYDEFSVIYWHFVASCDRLLSARRHPSRSLAAAYHFCQSHSPPPASPMAIVHLALTDFCRTARVRMAALDAELDAIEDALVVYRQGGSRANLAPRIGQVRREAIEVRRALAPVARAMDDAEEEWPAWALTGEHVGSLTAVMGVLDDIGALNERARSLQDELTSQLADQTNRQLYLVSVVTTLVMPATFVTGFFGMNTGGFVWGESVPLGTLYAGLTCLGAVLLMLALLRWSRLL